jgi:hypothetical protein
MVLLDEETSWIPKVKGILMRYQRVFSGVEMARQPIVGEGAACDWFNFQVYIYLPLMITVVSRLFQKVFTSSGRACQEPTAKPERIGHLLILRFTGVPA